MRRSTSRWPSTRPSLPWPRRWWPAAMDPPGHDAPRQCSIRRAALEEGIRAAGRQTIGGDEAAPVDESVR